MRMGIDGSGAGMWTGRSNRLFWGKEAHWLRRREG